MEREISITYMSGPLDGKTLRFDQPDVGDELTLSLGRREGCDIHLSFDNQASRLHARLGCISSSVTASMISRETVRIVPSTGFSTDW